MPRRSSLALVALWAVLVAPPGAFAGSSAGARAPAERPITIVTLRAGVPPAFALAPPGATCDPIPATVTKNRIDEAKVLAQLSVPGVQRVIVLVTGFATSPRLGLRVARRIAHDLGPSVAILQIDWGSAGKLVAYEADVRTARKNAPAVAAFLSRLHVAAPNRELDVFAHSLGTRIVAMTMATIPNAADRRAVVQRAVFAAPDMTIPDYQKAIARNPEPFSHVTLYVSGKDRALLLSDVIHLHARLGRVLTWRKALARTDVVDATVASSGAAGHGYAIGNDALVRDIGQTLAGAPVPHPLWKKKKATSPVWIYTPTAAANRPGDPGTCATPLVR